MVELLTNWEGDGANLELTNEPAPQQDDIDRLCYVGGNVGFLSLLSFYTTWHPFTSIRFVC